MLSRHLKKIFEYCLLFPVATSLKPETYREVLCWTNKRVERLMTRRPSSHLVYLSNRVIFGVRKDSLKAKKPENTNDLMLKSDGVSVVRCTYPGFAAALAVTGDASGTV